MVLFDKLIRKPEKCATCGHERGYHFRDKVCDKCSDALNGLLAKSKKIHYRDLKRYRCADNYVYRLAENRLRSTTKPLK